MTKCSKGRCNFHLEGLFRKFWIHSNKRRQHPAKITTKLRRNKHSPNSPVEYKVRAEEHCRSLRGLGSKASTPLWLLAELPTSNTETLRWENSTGMCLKVPEDVPTKAPSSGTPQSKWTQSTLEAQRSWKEQFNEGQGRKAGWPQMCPNSQSFLVPCRNFKTWESTFPKAPEPSQQFTFCFHISPLRQGVTMGCLKRPPNTHWQQASPQTNQRGQRLITQKHRERNTALEQEKKPQGKQKGSRDKNQGLHHNILGVVACRGVEGGAESSFSWKCYDWALSKINSVNCLHQHQLLSSPFSIIPLWFSFFHAVVAAIPHSKEQRILLFLTVSYLCTQPTTLKHWACHRGVQ